MRKNTWPAANDLLLEGWNINHKRVYRLYLEEGLNLRQKAKRRQKSACRTLSTEIPSTLNECWAMDFVSDQLYNVYCSFSLMLPDYCRNYRRSDNYKTSSSLRRYILQPTPIQIILGEYSNDLFEVVLYVVDSSGVKSRPYHYSKHLFQVLIQFLK